MDHQEAARQKLVERYLLNELNSAQADEFEAHLFVCPQCSEALRAGSVLMDNARAVFRANSVRPQGEAAAGGRQHASGGAPGRKKPWLESLLAFPAVAPALAALALLAVVSYQNLIQIPGLRAELESAAGSRFVEAYSLLPVTRGDEQILTAPKGARSIVLTFDLTSVSKDGYLCVFTRDDGREWLRLEAPHPSGAEMLTLQLDPARIPPGRNLLTVRTRGGEELSRYRFTFQP